eukprot:768581-Hanusia_phi.AAC.3
MNYQCSKPDSVLCVLDLEAAQEHHKPNEHLSDNRLTDSTKILFAGAVIPELKDVRSEAGSSQTSRHIRRGKQLSAMHLVYTQQLTAANVDFPLALLEQSA